MTDATATETGFPGPPEQSPPPVAPRRAKRWPWVLLSIFIVLCLIWWGLGFWTVNDYVITPGDATPVAPYITVPAHLDHPLTGDILLTDVYVTPLNVRTYLQYRFFSSDSEIIANSALLGPSTPPDQFVAQGYLDMTQAQSYATAAALTHLGQTVTSHKTGALIYGITPGSPADASLKVAQVITGVNGQATPGACAVVNSLKGLKPGTSITLSVEDSTISDSGTFRPGPIVQKKVTVAKPPRGLIETGCSAKPTVPTAYLGIEPEDQVDWTFPVKVEVHTTDIGGPSAGLAMTLGIIDKLSGGNLTGKRIVAATGTIDPEGDVGDVGGVAEKTVAVERAGATVFFVPPQELSAARSKATPQLHVYAVSSLDQALRILKSLGGTMSTSHVLTEKAP